MAAAAPQGRRPAAPVKRKNTLVTSKAAQSLLRVAVSQLGQGEDAKGRTKYGRFYGMELKNGRYFVTAPWCAMFLQWCAFQVGFEKRIPRTASTVALAKALRKKGQLGDKPVPGAIAFFDWQKGKSLDGIDHVGLVESVDPKTGWPTTIEGNASNKVKRCKRNPVFIVCYGYLRLPE